MAEAGTHGEGHGDGHEGHGSDPLAHIKDNVIIGLGKDGQAYWWPVKHGHKQKKDYVAQEVGAGIKVQFDQHMLCILIIAVLLTTTVIMVARKVIKNIKADEAPRGPLANMVEAILLFVRDDVVVPTGGHHVAAYTPMFVTYFMFILVTNLSGMIPLFGSATGNIAVTGALGGSVFLTLTLLGIYKQGPIKYFLNMVPHGTPLPLWPLMFVLEFTGPIIKCFVLCVRLFANMIAGHLVISNVLALGAIGKGATLSTGLAVMSIFIGVPLALGISMLEILVCFIQAYVFMMLSVIFVSAAVHPEH